MHKTIAIDFTVTSATAARATVHGWRAPLGAGLDQYPAQHRFRVVIRPLNSPVAYHQEVDDMGAPSWTELGSCSIDHGAVVALAFSRLALSPEPLRRSEMPNGAILIDLGEV